MKQSLLVRFMWGVTAFSALLGGLMALAGILTATTAPQEAAAAAMGCVAAIVPYVITRALAEIPPQGPLG